jgi:outer membrane protein TolC
MGERHGMRSTLYPFVLAVVMGIALPRAARADALTLEVAVEKGVALDEAVRIARARTTQADAAVQKARSALLPDLEATGTYTRRSGEVTRTIDGEEVVTQSANALSANVTLSSTVFDPSAWPAVGAAKKQREATKLDEVDQRRRTGFSTAGAFLLALGQERIVQAATDRRDLAQARRKEVAARVEAQLTGRNDLTQADLELATAERELTAASVALTDAYAQLAYWIGEPVRGPLVEPTWLYTRASEPAIAKPAPPRDAAAIKLAIAGRPDLAAARLRIDSAVEAAKIPGRRIWPVVGVFGQVRFTNEAGLSGNDTDWSLGVTATWSIWDGGERAADARSARAAAEIAKLESAGAERRAATELDTAQIQLDGARADVAAATTAAEAAARNVEEVGILYGQGLVRALEVTDAASRKFDAEVARVRATIAVAAAYLDLVAATGGEAVPAGGTP